jgi:hypothetical protein
MALHDSPPIQPTAAWITRYAADLLRSRPGLQPLDAVRLALDAASAGAATERAQKPSKSAAHPRTGQH